MDDMSISKINLIDNINEISTERKLAYKFYKFNFKKAKSLRMLSLIPF